MGEVRIDWNFPRVDSIPNYVLAEVSRLKAELRRKGADVIDLGMGNPDGPTPRPVVRKLLQAARERRNHRYSVSRGITNLRKEIANRYQRDYGVTLDPETEALVTIGAKNALDSVLRGILNPNGDDWVVSTNPAYPIHYWAVVFADGKPVMLPLISPEDFLNRLEDLFRNMAPKRPRAIVISFPHNPTTICVDLAFMQAIVDMGLKHGTLIIHDFAYADGGFDGYKPPSILQIPGAKEVAVEIFSMSKSYNMAGWRVGFLLGNPKMVAAATKIKTYLDYGVFQPIQIASIIALRDCQEDPARICAIQQRRRDVLVAGLNRTGWPVDPPGATMFQKARLPEKHRSMGSLQFSRWLLEHAHVAVAPFMGFVFGEHLDEESRRLGEEHVRLALIENENRLRQAVRNIDRAFHEKPLSKQKKPRLANINGNAAELNQ